MYNLGATLTAANIRYLLAIDELDRDSGGAKSSEIAKLLCVKKSSVNAMITTLCGKGYVTKEKYRAVHLTESGKKLAEKYSEQYTLLYNRMEHSLELTPERCRNAVCAVLAQTVSGEPGQPVSDGVVQTVSDEQTQAIFGELETVKEKDV